jgi:hypothetical protein
VRSSSTRIKTLARPTRSRTSTSALCETSSAQREVVLLLLLLPSRWMADNWQCGSTAPSQGTTLTRFLTWHSLDRQSAAFEFETCATKNQRSSATDVPPYPKSYPRCENSEHMICTLGQNSGAPLVRAQLAPLLDRILHGVIRRQAQAFIHMIVRQTHDWDLRRTRPIRSLLIPSTTSDMCHCFR